MSKSGTIIIVDDNKADSGTNPFKKLLFESRHTVVTGHTDHCDTRGNTGSGTIRYEFHFGHQYRQ